jgi:hypothetical protein
MCHLLCKALTLSAITLLCVYGINRPVLEAGRICKDGASIICEEKRKAVRARRIRGETGRENVLFMGSSKILAGIIPQQFDEATGGRTYSWNLSLPALTIGPHYFMLKDYLQHNPPPEYIVLKLSARYGDSAGIFDSYGIQGATVEEILSYALNRPNKNVVWNYFFPWRLYRNSAIEYMRARWNDPQSLELLRSRNRAIVEKMFQDRGYYFIREQAVPSGCLPDDYRAPGDGTPEKGIDFDRDPYVHKFFDLAEQSGIRVLVVEPPYRPGEIPQRTSMPAWGHKLLAQYRNVHLADGAWKLKIYENRLFSDPVHPNPEGAKRFTREIYSEFIEAFGAGEIPDRVGLPKDRNRSNPSVNLKRDILNREP